MQRKERAAIKMLKCTTLSVLPPTCGMSTHTKLHPCVSSSDNKNDRNSPFPSPLSSTSPVPLPSSHSIMYRAAKISLFLKAMYPVIKMRILPKEVLFSSLFFFLIYFCEVDRMIALLLLPSDIQIIF